MRFPLFLVAPALIAISVSSSARADNSSDAIDELKQGYALKQAGNCSDAIPHFARSFQLDPKPKALLNRADCEAQTGDLLAAQGHAAQGRQLARQDGDAQLVNVADAQLAAIEKRLPRLTITLAAGAPQGSVVSIDGAPVDHDLLGNSEGVNPGAHAIVVTAAGYARRRFDLTLVEGVSERIQVAPGGGLGANTSAMLQEGSTSRATSDVWPRRAPAIVALGSGAVGLVVGIATGLAGASKHTALERECSGNACPSAAQGDIDAFHSLRTISTVGYIVGFAGLAGGAVLWLTAPSSRPSGAATEMWIGPASAGLTGSF